MTAYSWQGNQSAMGKGWGRRSKRQLRLEPYCQWIEDGIRCRELADQADHIKPRFEGGTDDESNLQSLCDYHHGKKTAAEGHRAWAAHKANVLSRFDHTEVHPAFLTD